MINKFYFYISFKTRKDIDAFIEAATNKLITELRKLGRMFLKEKLLKIMLIIIMILSDNFISYNVIADENITNNIILAKSDITIYESKIDDGLIYNQEY